MPDMTATLDFLEYVRGLYALSFMPGWDEPRLWRIEKYLMFRLERVGVAVPDDEPEPDGADPADENDYAHELTQPDIGGSD